MYCEPLNKPKKKPNYRYKPVNTKVMAIVKERSGGICEYCHSNTATAPHHIKLKSQGGLDIPINILHVCNDCHNHSNTEFLQSAKEILRDRVDIIFPGWDKGRLQCWEYTPGVVALNVDMEIREIERQIQKGFLKKHKYLNIDTCNVEEIRRWLGVLV